MSEESLTFEQALEQLEQVVAKLEMGELDLQASVAIFEEGQRLAAYCNQQLEEATLKVEQLTADGEIAPLDPTTL